MVDNALRLQSLQQHRRRERWAIEPDAMLHLAEFD
jgi:hypothetical protein